MNEGRGLNHDYDVVIAGGGMVGASLALLLQRQSAGALNILVVERVAGHASPTASTYSSSFDARSTALSYGSQIIYQQLGLWRELSQHATAIERIHVSERGAFASALMHAETMQWPALGYVVENAWLGRVLLSALLGEAIELACPATVSRAEPQSDGVTVSLSEDGQERKVTTQLLVVADGAQSPLRKQLGISHQAHSYHQSAVVANVSFQKPHQHIAYERFTDQGPMALLPLSDANTAALVWTQNPEQAQQLCSSDEGDFLAVLQQRFGHRLGQFIKVGERATYPLQLVKSDEQVRSHIVVMGNAAHALHPVAGQGFNLALRDCVRLSDSVVAAQQSQKNIGELSVLQRYQQAQRFDQQKTTLFSDKVGAVFSNSAKPLCLLRNLGLLAVDNIPDLKQGFVRHAAGLHHGAALGFGAKRGING